MSIVAPLQNAQLLRRRPRLHLVLRRRSTRGQGLVEYALLLMLIAIVVIALVTAIGLKTSNFYRDIDCGFGSTQAACQANSESEATP